MKRFLASIALLSAMLLPIAVFAQHALPRDSVYQLDASMTDQSARSTPLASRRGRVQLVSMFYTSCRYICPLIIDSGLAIEKKLTPAEKQRLGITLISMDPKRDNPAALSRVATRRKLDLKRWALLRPQSADVRSIAGVLGIRYRELADGEFNHTSALVLLDAEAASWPAPSRWAASRIRNSWRPCGAQPTANPGHRDVGAGPRACLHEHPTIVT